MSQQRLGVWLIGALDSVLFCGHDSSDVPLSGKARGSAAAGVMPAALPPQVAAQLHEVDARIRPGAVGQRVTVP